MTSHAVMCGISHLCYHINTPVLHLGAILWSSQEGCSTYILIMNVSRQVILEIVPKVP